MRAPNHDVALILQAAGIGTIGGMADWAIYATDREPPAPDRVITLYNTGGTTNPAWVEDQPTVQVRVRGAKGGYQEAWRVAEACKAALRAHQRTESDGAVVQVARFIGDVQFLEYDERDRPIFVLNVELHREEKGLL